MPFKPGPGDFQENKDVYSSPNVFANNVPIALWLPPGSSSAFAGLQLAGVTPLTSFGDPNLLSAANAITSDYLANPGASFNAVAQADGVKANYPGTAADASTSTGTISATPSASDIIPFLQTVLGEASRGLWRETGQGGKPSNPNILKIWAALGFPGTNINNPTANASPWNTDQTAWCMGFVNFTLLNSGYRWVPTASAQAITTNPQRWNATQVAKEQAQPGDIAYWSYHHVNFVYTASGGKYSFVGGNQTPKGGSNNPSDGDVTISYPGGTPASNGNWVSCWRPSRT
jgi:hypothetical protein